MSSEKKGHGNSTVHGHGHKSRRPSEPANRNTVKPSSAPTKQLKPKHTDLHDDEDIAVVQLKEEAAPAKQDEETKKTNDTWDNEEMASEEKKPENETHNHVNEHQRREFKKSNVTPENFNVKEFNTNLSEFIQTLEDPRYRKIEPEYPVEDLKATVNLVAQSLNYYTAHSSDTEQQLADLRDSMKAIKEDLHFSVTRQALNLKAEDEHHSLEERELHAKLTQLNCDLAQAGVEVTEAIRLATEAESTAVRAHINAERARAEADRVKEVAANKDKAEQINKEETRRRLEEERRQKEETERKIQEENRKTEEEWKRREAIQSGKAGHVYESWEPVEYGYTNESGEPEVACIARGQPGSFDKHQVICKVANEKEALVTYQANEELISHVVDLTSDNGEVKLKKSIYVAIPHVLSRSGAQSREAVVKALSDGEWKDLPTRELTFDNHKDVKFAQAEVRHLTTLIIVSRLKRDYVTLAPNKSQKVTSSFDHRITLNVERKTFAKPEHFLMQVHPVDSGTFQEFRTRQPNGKKLLSCSPVVHTQWESTSFGKPVEVTLSCPPNPAKAKKLALARKMKEEKMNNPSKRQAPIEEQEREKEKVSAKIRQQEQPEGESAPVKATKWYMGDYANTDDDETDTLHFVYMAGGKWHLHPDIVIRQVKVDVLYFRLEFPVERFIVLRTRTTLEEDAVVTMAAALSDFLGKRFVEAIIRQKSDNPCEVALQVIPVSRLDAAVKQLASKGFESGPASSHVICLQEGDLVEVGFAGNIECADNDPEQLIYKSNIPTLTYFTVKEENRFRQKEQDVYSGLIQLTRRFLATPAKVKKGQGQTLGQSPSSGQGEDGQQPALGEWKREPLCTIQINFPKYNNGPATELIKVPVAITTTGGPVDSDLLMTLAISLGDEWKRVAHYLGVHRARVQAIMRNVTVGERSDSEAKYDMLVTWLKGAAKALDKVSTLSSALAHGGRHDLAETVKDKNRDFIDYRRSHMTAVN